MTAIAATIAFSAGVQVLSFGVLAWFTRNRSEDGIRIIGGLCLLSSLFLDSLVTLGRFTVLGIAVLLAVIGLLITYAAYYRWLGADFD